MREASDDMTGQTFGLWTVIEPAEGITYSSGTTHPRYLCECKCGTRRAVEAYKLRIGRSRSCGCAAEKRYTVEGVERNISEHCRHYGINRFTVLGRLRRGWTPEGAFTTPARSKAEANA